MRGEEWEGGRRSWNAAVAPVYASGMREGICVFMWNTVSYSERSRETDRISERVQRRERKGDIEPMTNQGVPAGSVDALLEKK